MSLLTTETSPVSTGGGGCGFLAATNQLWSPSRLYNVLLHHPQLSLKNALLSVSSTVRYKHKYTILIHVHNYMKLSFGAKYTQCTCTCTCSEMPNVMTNDTGHFVSICYMMYLESISLSELTCFLTASISLCFSENLARRVSTFRCHFLLSSHFKISTDWCW